MAQGTSSPYLVRMERQTRAENVCMLLQKDGHYHLERIITGRPRVFEGTLPSSSVSEIEPLLNSDQITNLKQSQIEMTLVGEDLDQVMIAISRPTGWQSLSFPTGASRKPFKTSMDPILKWLDRNKQQQNPIVGAPTNRCMPPQTAQAGGGEAKPNPANPYIMRIVIDHYEPSRLSGGAQAASSKVQSTNSAPSMNSTADMKVTRLCTVVYESGRYRLEKSIQEFGTPLRPEIHRDTLDKAQLDELRKLLDNPKLVALPNSVAPAVFAREGDLISLAIPREKGVQAVSFASFFGARTQEAGMRDNTSLAVSANVELTHPIRKWIKQNIEDRKSAPVKDVPATTCIPSTQPE
ncbi:MAG: hypothetical protein WCC22_20300 [Terriglobales bacterium]